MKQDQLNTRGTAVFVPLQPCWDAVHQATRQAIAAGRSSVGFLITGKELFYRDSLLDGSLLSENLLADAVKQTGADYTGCSSAGIHCVLLYSVQSSKGVLVHLEKNVWQCACFPVLTAMQLHQEFLCAEHLKILAKMMEETECEIEIRCGKWKLDELLEALGTMLE